MEHRIPLHSEDTIHIPESEDMQEDGSRHVLPDLSYKQLAIANVIFYGRPLADEGNWVLIDAGVTQTAGFIRKTAERRFGTGTRPAAIIITHGHFDHVGALRELVDKWEVPVYAHELELPYLTGQEAYPPANPSVGGGLMSLLSPFYPRDPVDVSDWIQPLPLDGSVPFMAGWSWIHTPGHTPGHISLFREKDRTLIAGDAVITTTQESAYAVATQRPELHGPPMYFTPDWEASRESVRRIAQLEPEVIVSGHGPAVHGSRMREALRLLARDFDLIAVPEGSQQQDDPRDLFGH